MCGRWRARSREAVANHPKEIRPSFCSVADAVWRILRSMKTSPTKQLFPQLASVKHFVDPTGSVGSLDAIVDAMVSGSMPRKHILLEGAIGSGKRHLARAIAREFGGAVYELEPHSVISRGEFAELLHSLRRGDVIIAHNVDEMGGAFVRDLVVAIIGRRAPAPAAPVWGSDPTAMRAKSEGAADMTWRLPEIQFIATTNMIGGVPRQVLNPSLKFALRSNAVGVAAGIARALRFNGVNFELAAVEPLAEFVLAAKGEDMSDIIVALVCAWQTLAGAEGRLVGEDARKIVQHAWSFMPAANTMRSFADALKVTGNLEAAVRQLNFPPHLASEFAAATAPSVAPTAESTSVMQEIERWLTPTPTSDDEGSGDDESDETDEE